MAGLASRWLEGPRREKFDGLAVGVQRRILHKQLSQLGLTPDFEMVERLRTAPNAPVTVNAEQTARRDAEGMVQLQKAAKMEFGRGCGEIVLAGKKGRAGFGGLALAWEIVNRGGNDLAPEANVEYFDADKVGEKVCLRLGSRAMDFSPSGRGRRGSCRICSRT